MYRVELKALTGHELVAKLVKVPNVPCGVESAFSFLKASCDVCVPNVPCGVESSEA